MGTVAGEAVSVFITGWVAATMATEVWTVPPSLPSALVLRLAVVLHRGRSRQPLPSLTLSVDEQRVSLYFPAGWLAEHPLTHADLLTESRYLKKAAFRLEFN